MAIYSCNLKSIGRKTHATGTAGAHLRYIARDGAQADIAAYHMPPEPQAAQAWMDKQEAQERANARVVSKVFIALPVELTEPQRHELVRAYIRAITQDRVPWYFAIHQSGEDAHNPHCHIVIRDREQATGKRVLMLSDSEKDRRKAGLPASGVEWIRAQWEIICNRHLEQAGFAARIDRRTLEAQGIDREATIHIGTTAQRADSFKERPQSQEREERTKRKRYRTTTPYPKIDQGRTRQERHAEIVAFNAKKAARRGHSNDNQPMIQEIRDMADEQDHAAGKENGDALLKQQPKDERDRLAELYKLERDLATLKTDTQAKETRDASPENQDQDQEQPIEEQAKLEEMEQLEKRIKAFKEEQEQEADDAKKQSQAHDEERDNVKSTHDLDITGAGSRYAQALG